MPFTLSHPLAALVLRPSRLPMAAMVAGTMAPDLPLFLPNSNAYPFTHSLLGIATADLGVGLAGLALWVWVVRDALVDTSPAFVRDRLRPRARYTRREWTLAGPAVLVGALTHVGWDELTHVGRWGPQHIAWLRDEHHGYPGYHWAQAGSSVIGLAGVLVWAVATVLRRPRRARAASVPGLTVLAPAATVAIAGVAAVLAGLPYLSQNLRAAAFAAAVAGTTTLGIAVVVVAAGWQVFARRRSGGANIPLT